MTLDEQIEAVIARLPFGKPGAVKRGRNPRLPYVPVIDHGTRTAQIKGYAFATRAEALTFCERSIEARRAMMREQFRSPRHRALRDQYGLPMEISK